MTVYDNIAFGLKVQKADRKTIHSRVMELVDLIGLRGLERRYPSQLSGGQRQRVAFARALAPNPQLLLLDEPFAAIDAKVRQELRTWLKEMISKLGVTSIFVTHDQDEAIEVADEIIITNRGRIEQEMCIRDSHRGAALLPGRAGYHQGKCKRSDYGTVAGMAGICRVLCQLQRYGQRCDHIV